MPAWPANAVRGAARPSFLSVRPVRGRRKSACVRVRMRGRRQRRGPPDSPKRISCDEVSLRLLRAHRGRSSATPTGPAGSVHDLREGSLRFWMHGRLLSSSASLWVPPFGGKLVATLEVSSRPKLRQSIRLANALRPRTARQARLDDLSVRRAGPPPRREVGPSQNPAPDGLAFRALDRKRLGAAS